MDAPITCSSLMLKHEQHLKLVANQLVRKFPTFYDSKVNYCVHRSRSVRLLSQINQVHTLTPYLRYILISLSHLHLCLTIMKHLIMLFSPSFCCFLYLKSKYFPVYVFHLGQGFPTGVSRHPGVSRN
jgi:hypothetical protein